MKGVSAVGRYWPWLGALLSVFGAAFTFFGGPVEPYRTAFFDFLLRQRPVRILDDPATDPIVLVGWDEDSSQALGNILPRDVMAKVIERLTHAGARVIILDFLLTEPDHASKVADDALESLLASGKPSSDLRARKERVAAKFDADQKLATAFRNSPVVAAYGYGSIRTRDASMDWKLIPEQEALDARHCEDAGRRIPIIVATPFLFEAQRSHAGAYVQIDPDGLVRKYPLFAHLGDSERLYPSLALMAAQIYFQESAAVDCDRTFVTSLSLGARDLTGVVDLQGRVNVDFTGNFLEMFPHYVSMVQVVKTDGNGGWTVPDERFRDKVVVFGPRSNDNDKYTTPYDGTFSGLGFHATVTHSLLTDHWLRRTQNFNAYEAVAALGLGLLGIAILALFPNSTLPALYAPIILVGGYKLSQSFLAHGYLVNAFWPALAVALSFIPSFALREQERAERQRIRAEEEQLRAEKEKKQREATQRELGRFLSPAIVDIALRNPDLLLPAKKEISILFSDIRGFTTTAEGMSPEALVALLDGYLTQMTQIVFDEKGTLDKYIGDAVMALFGAPVTFEDHPANACKAALEMMRSLEKMQVEWRKTGQPVLDIGIGVNTGVVSVGRMGSSGKSEYTCLGDEVNFASRLEGLNKAYGTHILVGENTRAKAGELFVFRNLGVVQVKGKKKATRIFELLSEREAKAPDPAWMSTWDRALLAFLARDWNVAEKLFCEVADTRGGDPAAQTYLEFIEVFRVTPPLKTWEGTMERHEK